VRAASLGDSGAVLTHRTHQVPAGRQEERHVALHPSPAVLAGVAVGTLLAGLAYGTLSGSAPLPERVELRASQASPVAPSGSQVTGTQAAPADDAAEATTNGPDAEGAAVPGPAPQKPSPAASVPVPSPAPAAGDADDHGGDGNSGHGGGDDNSGDGSSGHGGGDD
jgi:hypothetical protein